MYEPHQSITIKAHRLMAILASAGIALAKLRDVVGGLELVADDTRDPITKSQIRGLLEEMESIEVKLQEVLDSAAIT